VSRSRLTRALRRATVVSVAAAATVVLAPTNALAVHAIADSGYTGCLAPRTVAVIARTSGTTIVYANGRLVSKYQANYDYRYRTFTGQLTANWRVEAPYVSQPDTYGTCF
jgi:hypothetical protein